MKPRPITTDQWISIVDQEINGPRNAVKINLFAAFHREKMIAIDLKRSDSV